MRVVGSEEDEARHLSTLLGIFEPGGQNQTTQKATPRAMSLESRMLRGLGVLVPRALQLNGVGHLRCSIQGRLARKQHIACKIDIA